MSDDPLIALFADGLGVAAADLDDDTSPENRSEWDSLAAITMVSLIENEFDIRLTGREIMKMQTIGLARSVLRSKGIERI